MSTWELQPGRCRRKPKPPQVSHGFTLVHRADGRVELGCVHGVGHSSEVLMEFMGRKVSSADTVHGCDGCCRRPAFAQAEAHFKGVLA